MITLNFKVTPYLEKVCILIKYDKRSRTLYKTLTKNMSI